MGKKPDSLRGRTREIYNTEGPEAAKKWALSQTDKFPWLRESNVLAWFRGFEKKASPPDAVPEEKVVVPDGKKEKGVAKLRGKNLPAAAKRRVYDVSEPNVHGSVVAEGEQVSTVKWDVAKPWGKESHTSNENLRDVEGPSPRDALKRATVFRVVRPNGTVKKGPKGAYREDAIVSEHKTFSEAAAAAADPNLWVFAVSKGGMVALLMRPHWDQYRQLETAQ
jgi:hypothetical protein